MTNHEQLLDQAKKSADVLLSDRSVRETRDSLKDLREHVNELIDVAECSLPGDDDDSLLG